MLQIIGDSCINLGLANVKYKKKQSLHSEPSHKIAWQIEKTEQTKIIGKQGEEAF